MGAALATPRGTLPVLQYCLPSQLKVDPLYQRELDSKSQRLIRDIAEQWDWSLCQPLVVASRRDGSLFVVDGQHRLEAARHRGDIAQLPCVIVHPADPADEAAAFVALNQRRRPLTAFAMYNGALAAGDEAAIQLQRLLDKHRLSFSGAADIKNLKPGQLNNIATVRKWHGLRGDGLTDTLLCCIGRAFAEHVITIPTLLFMGSAAVVLEHGTDFDTDLFTAILDRPQDEWKQDFRQRAAADNSGLQAAAVAVLLDSYAEAIGE